MTRILLTLALAASTLAVPACQERGNFVIENPYIKPPLGGRDVGSAYMTFVNRAYDLELVAVTSPETSSIEIHETTRTDDGIARMERLDSLPIPRRGEVVLEPGGKHLMLFGLTADEAADGITVTLEFDDGSTYELELEPKAE